MQGRMVLCAAAVCLWGAALLGSTRPANRSILPSPCDIVVPSLLGLNLAQLDAALEAYDLTRLCQSDVLAAGCIADATRNACQYLTRFASARTLRRARVSRSGSCDVPSVLAPFEDGYVAAGASYGEPVSGPAWGYVLRTDSEGWAPATPLPMEAVPQADEEG